MNNVKIAMLGICTAAIILAVAISYAANATNATNEVVSVSSEYTNVCSNCEINMRKMELMMGFEGQTGLLMKIYMTNDPLQPSETNKVFNFNWK
tara:strand:- start:21 stop:302 length:282 start_codon:yes stop_codon:yes gene_type:complete